MEPVSSRRTPSDETRTGGARTAAQRDVSPADPKPSQGPAFDVTAQAITYRRAVERDTCVTPGEVERARACLERVGIVTMPQPDGRFRTGRIGRVVDAACPASLRFRHVEARRVWRIG